MTLLEVKLSDTINDTCTDKLLTQKMYVLIRVAYAVESDE